MSFLIVGIRHVAESETEKLLKFLSIFIPKNVTVFSLKGVRVSAALQPVFLAGSLAALLFSHS